MREALRHAGISQPATPHTLRHSFATSLLDSGYNIDTVQELPGDADVSTTMIYTHVLKRGVRSPFDALVQDGAASAKRQPPPCRVLQQQVISQPRCLP